MNLFSYRDKEFRIIVLFFIISCVHSIGLLIAMIALLAYLKQGVQGAIKALLLISIRTPMSPAIAVSFGSLQTIKWIMIFGFCGLILINSGNIPSDRHIRLKSYITAITLFSIIAASGSIMNSSYPVTALFKISSFYIAIVAITRGIAATEKPGEYLRFCVIVLTPLMVVSIFLIPFGRFRIINSTFQGVFNHPNMFAIIGAIYICLLVMYKKFYDRGSLTLILAVLVMIYLTASRTGMISAAFCLLMGYKYMFPKNLRMPIFALISIVAITMLPNIWEMINGFLYKQGANYSILYSREGQLANFLYKYNAHQLMGSGFAVPYYAGVRDFSLNLSLQVEPGNIIWAVLGDCGVIGFISFIFVFLNLSLSRFDFSKIVLVAVPLLVSMGEMAFFSVNSIAPLYYAMFGIYMFIGESREEIIDEYAAY